MGFQEITNLILNNGVAVGLLVYFVYRDNKFMNTLNVSLMSLKDTTESIKDMMLKQGESQNEKGN